MGMKKLIFHWNNIFGSGHFLVYFLRSHGSKIDRSQKIYFNEKSVFSCPSTSRRNFWIFFMPWLYFHDWFLKLYEVISKLCDLGGCSYLDNKCSPSLCLPAIWCTKLEMKYGFPLLYDRYLLSVSVPTFVLPNNYTISIPPTPKRRWKGPRIGPFRE